MRFRFALVLLLGFSMASARAGDGSSDAGPAAVARAADQVVEAARDEDTARLTTRAADLYPDAWLVVEELARRGEHDAAAALAAARQRADAERLVAYAERLREATPPASLWKTMDEAATALAEGRPDEALGVLSALEIGDDPKSVTELRLAMLRGHVTRALRMGEDAAEAYLSAAASAGCLGWLGCEAAALSRTARCAYDDGDFATAIGHWRSSLALLRRLGDQAGEARTLNQLGGAFHHLRRFEDAAMHQKAALEIAEEIADRTTAALTHAALGQIHLARGRYADALGHLQAALALHEQAGAEDQLASTLRLLGMLHSRRGSFGEARQAYARALAIQREAGNLAEAASTLLSLGWTLTRLGRHQEALAANEEALAIFRELDAPRGIASAHGGIAVAATDLGEFGQAREHYERALSISREEGNQRIVAALLGNLGILEQRVGDYERALFLQKQSLEVRVKLEDVQGEARCWVNLGSIHFELGRLADAQRCLERARAMKRKLGARADVAMVLGQLGRVRLRLRDLPGARARFRESLTMRDALGDRAGVAWCLDALGNLAYVERDYEVALEHFERAVALKQELGDHLGAADTMGNLGNVHYQTGDLEKALGCQQRALALSELGGSRDGVALWLANLALTYLSLGDYEAGLDHAKRALGLAEESGLRWTEGLALWSLAGLHLRKGEPAKAAELGRRAVARMGLVVRGLADAHAASSRESWSELFAMGATAGVELGDPAEVSFFLESGRAGALLEALDVRRVVMHTIPEELRTALSRARSAESDAVRRWHAAQAGGRRREIRERKEAADAAHRAVLDVVERIQREEKDAADVLYPEALPLSRIQENLVEDEALVTFGLFNARAFALVATSTDARTVVLGAPDDIRSAAARLDASDPAHEVAPAVSALRALLINPLALTPETRRLLVSPHDVLADVPFSLLVPDREVALVPSGTTYDVLCDARTRRGDGVLALGEPTYDRPRDPSVLAAVRGGHTLLPLPGTRAEAEAVGDRVLLAGDATERKLTSALGERERWRAVHLACHGLIRPDQPRLSSLAITADPPDDGFLTVSELFGMAVPADLVVLSACETARGRIYRAEGVLGFVRALMLAGAPRVIVSLWMVDDEATRALMVKFYELWNPKEGRGLGAAAALMEARAFVRDHPDHPEWKHPYYWAAWVLWGLPE